MPVTLVLPWGEAVAKLTSKAVENIKPIATRREIPDGLLPGLYLIVQPSGARSWAVRYRHNGRPRKHTLGSYPGIDLKSARALGTKVLRAAAEGRDPTGERQDQRANTVAQVVAQFLAKYGQRRYRPRTFAEAQRLLKQNVVAHWGRLPIASVTRKQLRDMLDQLVANDTPMLANRVHSVARKLFGWAVEQEIIEVSPFAGLKAPAEEKSRDRILSDQELRAVWQAGGQMGAYGVLVRLLILTGQRRGEIAGLMWSEVDLDKRLISLPRERVKNNRAHEIPLSRQAIALIEALPRLGDCLFSVPIGGFGKLKAQLDKLCGVTDWVLHDIRRSAVSGMARLGVGLPVIEKVVNHVSGSFAGVVGIYQRHDFSDEKRKALEKWANHVSTIVTGKAAKAKVVKLR
jgi:integrase